MSPSHPPFRWASVSAEGTLWLLRRNCSVSPKQVGWFFAGLCGVSLGVAGFFWSQGATLVLPFTAVELMAVGTAFPVFARHATDRERISLLDGRLVVELETAGEMRRCEFLSQGVQIDTGQGREGLIELRGGGHAVHVGRYLRPDLRPELAREIALALREG